MKIYTTHFNANQPSNKQINIPNHSTAKIGIAVEKNGQTIELSGTQINLVDGDNVISCDDVYNGYATFPITTGNENEDKCFTLSCNKNVSDIDNTWTLSSATTQYSGTLTVSLSDYVGVDLRGTSISILSSYYNDAQGRPIASMQGAKYFKNNQWYVAWFYPATITFPKDRTGWYKNTGGMTYEYVDSVKVEEGDYIVFGAVATTPEKPTIWKIKQESNLINTTFNLRINSDKSSVFDKTDVTKDNVKDIMSKKTMVLTGTYVDDTPFQFTIPAI